MKTRFATLPLPEEYDPELCRQMAIAFLQAQAGIGDKNPYLVPMWYAFKAGVKYLENKQ